MKRGRKSSNNTFTENGKKIWKCGKYKRLSKEDGHDVSYSIENQDAILDYYLANHPEIQVVDNYQDDGRTGTDSDREDFQRLLADIYAKKINCVIVKDLSRLSRNDFESFPAYDFWWKLSEDGSTQRKPKSCGILRILASVFRFYLNPPGFPSSSRFCPEL